MQMQMWTAVDLVRRTLSDLVYFKIYFSTCWRDVPFGSKDVSFASVYPNRGVRIIAIKKNLKEEGG